MTGAVFSERHEHETAPFGTTMCTVTKAAVRSFSSEVHLKVRKKTALARGKCGRIHSLRALRHWAAGEHVVDQVYKVRDVDYAA